jgi:hypothetical protein
MLILHEHWWYLLILHEHWWYLPIISEHWTLVLLGTNWHHFILISVALVPSPTLVSIANSLLALVIFANPLWALVIFANHLGAVVIITNPPWALVIGVVGDQLTSFHTHQCCIGTTPSLYHQHWSSHWRYLLILYWHWWYLLILSEHWWYLPILYEHLSLVLLVTNWHQFILISVALLPLIDWIIKIVQYCKSSMSIGDICLSLVSIGYIYQSSMSIGHWCCWWPTDIISYSSVLHWYHS